MAKSKRRSRRIFGILPTIGKGLSWVLLWGWRNPQPVLVTFLVGGMMWTLWDYTRRSDSFRITQVRVPGESNLKVPPLIGLNIWQLDLVSLSSDLQRQQPWLKHVRVVRRLPSTIGVEAVPRAPVAQLQGDKWYPVDAEGVFLPSSPEGPSDMLPKLVGASKKGASFKPGAAGSDEKLLLALRVIQQLRRSPALFSRRVQTLDVTHPAQITFFLDGETQIRCGSEAELPAQLARLKTALSVVNHQQLAVEYIDVRFQDPVVSPKTS